MNLPKLVNFTNGDQIEIIYNAKEKLMKRIYHTVSTSTEKQYRSSFEFAGSNLEASELAVTSWHEVFGHGIPSARNETPEQNNSNAIRTDNLIRRMLGLPQRDGLDHAGGAEGQINNPQELPYTK